MCSVVGAGEGVFDFAGPGEDDRLWINLSFSGDASFSLGDVPSLSGDACLPAESDLIGVG